MKHPLVKKPHRNMFISDRWTPGQNYGLEAQRVREILEKVPKSRVDVASVSPTNCGMKM